VSTVRILEPGVRVQSNTADPAMISRTGMVWSGVDIENVTVVKPAESMGDPGRRKPRGQVCRCGHPKRAHQHYRAGTDCALCTCTRLKLPLATRFFFWRR
jgi:hypothetical protein